MPEIDLFAVQPYVTAQTYVSEESFRQAMSHLATECRLRRRKDAGGREVPALAVFPENIATFLALTPLGRAGAAMPSGDVAAALALLVRPGRFARALREVGPRHLEVAALLALAPDVERVYTETFRDLARSTGMTIVAGSALLPDGGSDVYNLSLTFDPEGEIIARTRKVNLVPQMEDVMGLTPGAAEDLPVADVPVGRVGTLICYDGFAVPHTRSEPGFRAVGGAHVARGARIIAHPAANPWAWDDAWIHREAGSTLLRREQWSSEGLEAQLPDLDGVRFAVTAHLVGSVLDQRFEGRSAIFERHEDGRVETVARAERAKLGFDAQEIVHARVEAPWLA